MFNQKLYFNKKTIFSNRISVSPMCQYKSLNGFPSDWHYHHLRNLMETGAGSLTVGLLQFLRLEKLHTLIYVYNYNHYLEHKKLIRYLKN